MEKTNLFLKPDEALFLGMAVSYQIEQLETSSQDQRMNWNPETRRMLKEMLTAGKGLKAKLLKMGIPCEPMPSYEEGDERNYLTKES